MTDEWPNEPQDRSKVGRVVLQLRAGQPSALALEAALRIARSFGSEIEGLFVEDHALRTTAQLPFTREISLMGRSGRELSLESLERDLALASASLRRQLEELARSAQVPLHFNVVRDEPQAAVAAVCASCTTSSVVALGEPFSPSHSEVLRQLMRDVSGLAGIALAGPKAKRSSGPVIATVEDIASLGPIVDAAERLAKETGGTIVILLIDRDPDHMSDLERAAFATASRIGNAQVVLTETTRGEPAVVAEAVRRLQGGFVVARYGGMFVPSEGSLAHLVQALECPLLLLR